MFLPITNRCLSRIINENKISENLWLLSGSDCCVHVFREDIKKQCFYKEKNDLFPELNNFESIVLWVDVLNYEENNELRRLSVVGCENGNIHLFFVELEDPNNPRIIKSWKNRFDGPVVSVKFFKGFDLNLIIFNHEIIIIMSRFFIKSILDSTKT